MKKLFIYIAVLLLGVTALSPAVAWADDSALFGACTAQTKNSPVCAARGTKTNPVNHTIKVAADIVAVAAGAAAVVMIVVSGFTFITAGGSITGQRSGDPNRLKTARATLTSAIIGLVIVALAWTIISFLTDRLIK